MEDALLLADVTRIVILHEVVVQLRSVVVTRLAKLAPRVPGLPQLSIALS